MRPHCIGYLLCLLEFHDFNSKLTSSDFLAAALAAIAAERSMDESQDR
jgi:hypothetical protein